MRPASSLVRSIALAPLLALAATACGSDGTGPARLTPEEVGGTYDVCSLVFQPQNALLPAIDVRARGIDTSPEARLRPSLRLQTDQRDFSFEYTSPPPSDAIGQLGGSYQLGSSTVTLVFSGAANARSALLLPSRVDLDFQQTPRKQLTSQQSPSLFSAPRADYARLAGVDEAGLAAEIPGTLNARFAVGGCE
jgi:hypothetical protein